MKSAEETITEPPRFTFKGGMQIFILIALGQLVSVVGSTLSGFALGVWVYERTGAATPFSFIVIASTLPNILISPLAGVLVDRWDRRRTIMLAEFGLSLTILAQYLLLQADRLELWLIYLSAAVSAAILAFLRPAYAALTPLLVSKKQLGRANGIFQLTQAVGPLIGPVSAGLLVRLLQIEGVLLIDFLSFLFPIFTMLLLPIPKLETAPEGAGRPSLWREALYGWKYLFAREGLFGLMVLFTILNFFTGMMITLANPLILSFASVVEMGVLSSIGGAGLLCGGIVMSVWGGPRRRVRGFVAFMLFGGFCILLAGLLPSAPLVAMAAFGFAFSVPFCLGCATAVWQSKVAPEVQGRVFALSSMLATSTIPLAALVAGPLADNIFEPLLKKGGLLADSVGQLIGVGAGRGIGLLFILIGLTQMLITLLGYWLPQIRYLESKLPDAIASEHSEHGERRASLV